MILLFTFFVWMILFALHSLCKKKELTCIVSVFSSMITLFLVVWSCNSLKLLFSVWLCCLLNCIVDQVQKNTPCASWFNSCGKEWPALPLTLSRSQLTVDGIVFLSFPSLFIWMLACEHLAELCDHVLCNGTLVLQLYAYRFVCQTQKLFIFSCTNQSADVLVPLNFISSLNLLRHVWVCVCVHCAYVSMCLDVHLCMLYGWVCVCVSGFPFEVELQYTMWFNICKALNTGLNTVATIRLCKTQI